MEVAAAVSAFVGIDGEGRFHLHEYAVLNLDSRAETPSDGYSAFNVNASCLLPLRNVAHSFSVRAYNLTNELYRLHTSLVKDFTPEMGRGIKFTYSLRFF